MLSSKFTRFISYASQSSSSSIRHVLSPLSQLRTISSISTISKCFCIPMLNENNLVKKVPSIYSQWMLLARNFADSTALSLNEYSEIAGDTLEELADFFDQLADDGYLPDESDCTLADGVLTVYLAEHGTYVINKQTPNRQIWLSSPTSGPKRYDLVNNTWFYSHDPNTSLHQLLSQELSEITKQEVSCVNLAYGKKS